MDDIASCGLTGRRILVVEDEYFIADEICTALTRSGAQVLGPAPSLEKANQLISLNGVDCAVLDIKLRGDDVFALAKRLRAEAVPIVFATGYGAEAVSGRLGSAAHLCKPIDLNALVKAVSSACERQ